MWRTLCRRNSTFCPSFSALLVLLLVGGSSFIEVTAISTNSSLKETTLQVEEITADGQQDALTSSTLLTFKPSSIESPPLQRLNFTPTTIPLRPSPRILKRRQGPFLPINYPGIVRKFDKEIHKLSNQQPPAVLTLFNGEEEKENSSTTLHSIFDNQENGQPPQHSLHQHEHNLGGGELTGDKQTRLYFEDVHRLPTSYKSPPHPPPTDYPDHHNSVPQHHHHGHHHHQHQQQQSHEQSNHKGQDIPDIDNTNHYYPKNLLSKQPPASSYESQVYKPIPDKHHHGHHHQGHGHYGNHHSEPEHHPHHGYSDEGHHGGDYRGHGHGHGSSIGPVISKALQLLIPSALFITGASALFPNRVHVATNTPVVETTERHKRSVEVPSMYLKREHRSDDSNEDYDYIEQSESRFGERNFDEIQPQPFEIIPTVLSREAIPIPKFQPMPTDSPPLPIVRMNRMKPVNQIRKTEKSKDEDDALEDYPVTKEMESKKLFTSAPTKFSTRRPPTILRPAKTTSYTSVRIAPQVIMSQLIKASMPELTTPSPTTIKVTTTPEPTTTTTTTTEKMASPNVEDENDKIQAESSYEKPFFRPLSTDRPETNSGLNPVTESDQVNGTVLIRRDTEQNSTFENRLGANSFVGKSKDEKFSFFGKSSYFKTTKPPKVDLSPESPVVGLLTNFAGREKESPECQKRALCELALRGASETGTKFEKFLWNLANLVPENLSSFYDLEDTFAAVVKKKCDDFECSNPNLDLQENK